MAYYLQWRLKAVSKSAVMVFARDPLVGKWKWGDQDLPTVTKCTYLGVDFTSNGAWDVHINKGVRWLMTFWYP